MTFQDSTAGAPAVSGLDEQRLLERARAGDVSAFNTLVLVYQRQAYTLAYRTLGNTDDAADATQEAFLSAFRALHSFRGGSFRAWLLRIVANACIDRARRRQRRTADSLDGLLAEAGEVGLWADPAPGPEGEALSAETAARIQAGLLELPPEQRLVVVMADIEGLAYEEIAVALHLSLGTVKSRLSRARAKLRAYLMAHGELPR